MHAAPRAVVHDLGLHRRRKLRQIAAIIRQTHRPILVQQLQRITQRHLAVLVVVPIAFPIRGNVHQLRLGSGTESRLQPRHQILARVQQPFKGHRARHRPVIEKHRQRPPGGKPHQVGPRRVHAVVRARSRRLAPRAGSLARAAVHRPHPPALVRRQNRKPDTFLGQHLQRPRIGCRLRQPHPLRHPAKPRLVVGNPPANLRPPVPLAGQRQNHVVVHLGQRRAVPLVQIPAPSLPVQHRPIDPRSHLAQPAQQRRANVEAHPRVVVHNPDNPVALVHNPRSPVRRVALRRDALVPVVIRRCRLLRLNRLQPRILPRRLIEMPVNADESFRHRPRSRTHCSGIRPSPVPAAKLPPPPALPQQKHGSVTGTPAAVPVLEAKTRKRQWHFLVFGLHSRLSGPVRRPCGSSDTAAAGSSAPDAPSAPPSPSSPRSPVADRVRRQSPSA